MMVALLCPVMHAEAAGDGVICTQCIRSNWSGGDHYDEYYLIHDRIRSVSDTTDVSFSYSRQVPVTRYIGGEEHTYYRYYIYYDYYPCLSSVLSKNSEVTGWVGTGKAYHLGSDMDVYSQIYCDTDVSVDGCGHVLKNRGGNMDIFYVRSGRVELSDMTIDGCAKICNVAGGTGVGSACITNDGGNLTLRECVICGSHNARSSGGDSDAGGTGVECFSGDTRIESCDIYDCDGFGIYVGNWRQPGACDKSRIDVSGCRIYDCGGGIGNAYGACVYSDSTDISATRWYKRGIYNGADGTFYLLGGRIYRCMQGIYNEGIFFMTGGEVSGNDAGIVQDGELFMSGEPVVDPERDRNFILLMHDRIIEVDAPFSTDVSDADKKSTATLGAIMTLSDDRKLGREVIRITYDKSEGKRVRYADSKRVCSHFIPAFTMIPDRTDRDHEGQDESDVLRPKKAEIAYSHPEDDMHPAVLRPGAGRDKKDAPYNGAIGSVVLSGEYLATFVTDSGVSGINMTMDDPKFTFYWMEPMSFPTSRRVKSKLFEKKIDETFLQLGWCTKPDGSGRMYVKDEVMSIPNDFKLYPVMDAVFALTYHSNFKNPMRDELKGELNTSYGGYVSRTNNTQKAIAEADIDTSYTVYPLCDGMHSENIIRGNTGPDDDMPDYLKRAVETQVVDINYGRSDYTYRYLFLGWSPTMAGITYRDMENDDPMRHLYVRDEDDEMRLYGDISLNKKRLIKDNDDRLFRLRFLSDYIDAFGIDYTDDEKYFNLHIHAVWDEAPRLCVKNIEIMERDVEDSLSDMLYERIALLDNRHEREDFEDERENLSVTIPDESEAGFYDRFHGLGEMGSVTVDYEIRDLAGNYSIYPVKVTVLSGAHPMVPRVYGDVNSGLKRAACYFRFIDEENADTLLPDSVWRLCEEYRHVLNGAFDK